MQTTESTNGERRKHHRYRLAVPAIFSWRDDQHTRHKVVGLTSGLSTHDAFVLTRTPPPLKAKIELKVFLPRFGMAAVPMRFQGEGEVVRVEAVEYQEARAGFAFACKHFTLRRGEE